MRIIVVSRKRLWMYTIATVAMICLLVMNGGVVESLFAAASAKRDLPIYSVDRPDKTIAISFDAAWGNEDTHNLIETLKKFNVKTTFFVVGGWVDKYPESVKELNDAGHEVMNHSNTHPHMTKLSPEQMKQEVLACDSKIQAITGKKPFLFRPPYGDYNDAVVQTMRGVGYYTIQWDVDSLDWKEFGVDDIVTKVTRKVKDGSIVLFHNGAKDTPNALPTVLDKLIKDGYKIVPVSELIYRDNFTIDHTGKQKKNSGDHSALD